MVAKVEETSTHSYSRLSSIYLFGCFNETNIKVIIVLCFILFINKIFFIPQVYKQLTTLCIEI